MTDINDSYQLTYTDDLGNKIIINEKLIKELELQNYSQLPENTIVTLEGFAFYIINFNNKKKLKILKKPKDCKFKNLNYTVKIFSNEHLKIILKKQIEKKIYTSPYYYSKYLRKNIYINIDKIDELEIYLEKYIEIKDNELKDYTEEINSLFNELNSIYHKDIQNYTFQYLSPNFDLYFNKLKINIKDKFLFIDGIERIYLTKDINNFLDKKNSSHIYPICGPHGIGKTISILLYHKILYKHKVKGLYINLKYFCNKEIKFENKIDTLKKESFFICNDSNELLNLYNKFITKNNIFQLFGTINEFIEMKIKKKDKGNKDNNDDKQKEENNIEIDDQSNDKDIYYIIIDQYQDMYNAKSLLSIFANIKIVLLSSINDYDVKNNIILMYEEKENNNLCEKTDIIRYNYVDDLFNDYYNREDFQELITNKIKKTENDEKKVKKELKSIYYILKKFGFIPKYFFEYLYNYNSIFDLIFNEYSNIIKKLENFLLMKKIDLDIIEELIYRGNLININNINSVQTLKIKDFIDSVKLLPLKYINFRICENGEFYFFFSFPYFETILSDFIYYQKNKKIYYTIDDGSDKGKIFERLLKYQFRVNKKLNIDGYFKVNALVDMKLTKKYTNINSKYLSTKNNIFIDQKNRSGADYDFAIYKPKSKQLVLFQSKYLINHGNVKYQKSLYKDSADKVLKLFNNLLSENKISEVYLYFISDVYHNYDDRKRVIEVLDKKRINCIFYSLKKDNFYLNFRDSIGDIELNNSNMLVPNLSSYTKQEAFDNSDFEKEVGIYRHQNTKEKEEEEKEEEEELENKERTNKKKNKKNKGIKKSEDIFFLEIKTKRDKNYDLKLIYNNIIIYIFNKSLINKQIISLLGPLKTIGKLYKIQFDSINEYAFILYLNDKNQPDYDKKIGLIFLDNKNNIKYYIDLQNNINYESLDELVEAFELYNFVIAIGEKVKKKNNFYVDK